MSLANLTASGWVLFALTLPLTLAQWLCLAVSIASRLGGKPDKSDPYRIAFIAGIFTAWLLWLVTT